MYVYISLYISIQYSIYILICMDTVKTHTMFSCYVICLAVALLTMWARDSWPSHRLLAGFLTKFFLIVTDGSFWKWEVPKTKGFNTKMRKLWMIWGANTSGKKKWLSLTKHQYHCWIGMDRQNMSTFWASKNEIHWIQGPWPIDSSTTMHQDLVVLMYLNSQTKSNQVVCISSFT